MTPATTHLVICFSIITAAFCWLASFLAYWRGWKQGINEERERWTEILRSPTS